MAERIIVIVLESTIVASATTSDSITLFTSSPLTKSLCEFTPYGVQVKIVAYCFPSTISNASVSFGSTTSIWSTMYVYLSFNTLILKVSPTFSSTKSVNNFADGRPVWPETTQWTDSPSTGSDEPSKWPIPTCSAELLVPW